MATIYQISEKYMLIQQMIEEGVEPEVFAEALKSIDGEASEKLEAYAMVMKNVESDISGLDAEIKRLQDRKKSMENNVQRMKQNMQMLIETVEGKKLKTDKFTFSLRKSKKVEIENELLIPAQFTIKEVKILKTEIKKAIEEGLQVSGASIVENQSLSIR